jgi:hypothetical protein
MLKALTADKNYAQDENVALRRKDEFCERQKDAQVPGNTNARMMLRGRQSVATRFTRRCL